MVKVPGKVSVDLREKRKNHSRFAEANIVMSRFFDKLLAVLGMDDFGL